MTASKLLSKTQATSVSQTDTAIYAVINRTGTPADRWIKPDDFFKSRTGNENVQAYADLAAAVAAISSTVATVEIPNSASVTADLTVPSNVTLSFTGGGKLTVSSGKTLTVNGPIVASARQIFSGSGTVQFGAKITVSWPEWFGAAMDGSTNDAAAIQKAIDAWTQTSSPHAGGDVIITGGTVINSTLTIQKNSIRIIGHGWGVTNEAPYGGWIKWNGSAGSPMLLIKDCWDSGPENIRFVGKSTAKPSAAIEFNRSVSAVTQMNHSFARNVWIGAMFGWDADDAVQFDAGILFSGSIDGDTNYFHGIVINKCTIGIDCGNPNASITEFSTLKITNCGTGVRCDTNLAGFNWNLGGNTLDLDILSDRQLHITELTTEGAEQYATLGTNSFLQIRQGGFQVSGSIPGSGIVIDANSSGSKIVLEDCRFEPEPGYSGPTWKIRQRNTGGAGKFYLRIINTRGISADNLDVQTVGEGLSAVHEVILQRAPFTGSDDAGTYSHSFFTNGEAFEEGRFDIQGRLNVRGGPMSVTALATPTTVAAAATGGSGTTYSYKVSAMSGSGETLASSAATCSGGATLGSSVYNTITWFPVIGATAYRVYGRTSGSELLIATISASRIFGASVNSALTCRDTGAVTPSGALPAINTTGAIRAADGNSTAPGIAFTSDTTAGLKRGSGYTAVVEGGNELLKVADGGNVTLPFGNLLIPQGQQFQWGTPDAGLARTAASTVKPTDGSTGYGKFELASGVYLLAGSGSPEGVVTANIGSIYMRTNGGAGTSMYVKESGSGNTGWVAK